MYLRSRLSKKEKFHRKIAKKIVGGGLEGSSYEEAWKRWKSFDSFWNPVVACGPSLYYKVATGENHVKQSLGVNQYDWGPIERKPCWKWAMIGTKYCTSDKSQAVPNWQVLKLRTVGSTEAIYKRNHWKCTLIQCMERSVNNKSHLHSRLGHKVLYF